ncbi:MAG: hypothetical protein ACLP9L_22875 [Thermoguttaceae bacterium]
MSKTDDRLLTGYSRAVRGFIFSHVYVGKRSGGSQLRELDGLRVLASTRQTGKVRKFAGSGEDFRKLLKGKTVEVIEVDKDLNRWVIGQAVVGKHLLEIQFEVYAAIPVVVYEVDDPLLRQVCARLGVRVWSPGHRT